MNQGLLAQASSFFLMFFLSFGIEVRAQLNDKLGNIQPEQSNSFSFTHPQLEDAVVTNVLQDTKGQLWIGSEEGLYRYDGFFVEKIDHRYSSDAKRASAPSGMIGKIIQLDERYLLIRTNPHKLFIFDLHKNQYVKEPYNMRALANHHLQVVFRYNHETLIGLSGAYIVKFNTLDKTLVAFPNPAKFDFYRAFLHAGKLYALSSHTLHVFDIEKESYTQDIPLPEKVGEFNIAQLQITPNQIHLLIRDTHWQLNNETFVQAFQLPLCRLNDNPSDTIHAQRVEQNDWVFYGNQCGVYRYSLSSNRREILLSNTEAPEWLYQLATNNNVQGTDKFVVATLSGIYLYDEQQNGLIRVTQHSSEQALLFSQVNDSLDSIYNNSKGGLLISKLRSQFKGISQHQLLFALGTDRLRQTIPLDNGELAIATQDNGLFIIAESDELLSQWKIKYHVLRNIHVRALHKIGHYIIVGTEGSGIYRFDLSNGKLTQLQFRQNIKSAFTFLSLANEQLLINTHYALLLIEPDIMRHEITPLKTFTGGEQYRAIAQDNQGNIWMGSHQSDRPLVLLDPSLNMIKEFNDSDLPHHVFHILVDSSNTLWLSTWGGGIAIKSAEQDNFSYIRQEDGLASDTVYSVYLGNDGKLWASTAGGISRIELCQMPCKPNITNFDKRDGLSTNSFDAEAHYQNDDGTLVFAGKGGLVWFNPRDDIVDNKVTPLPIFYNSAIIDSQQVQQIPLLNSELRLPHTVRRIDLRFTSPNYITPEKNQYRYRVNSGEWINLESPQINLSFLQAGTYQLEATSSNNQGVWSEQPAMLRLIITPPWWHTPVAYIIYVLTILLVGFSILYWRIKSIKQYNRKLEKLVSLRTAKLEKVLLEKEQIFQNISHEFRTPLTIILGQAERLLADKKSSEFRLISEQAERLFALVERLLKLAELRSIKLNIQAVKLVDETQRLIAAMVPLAENKHISLVYHVDASPKLYVDLLEDSLALILNNLLRNAIEYSAENTRVNININIVENRIKLDVEDQGEGFADTEKVLERFERERNDGLGSGLGLAIVREIVVANGGQLQIRNKDVGASISVELPLNISKTSMDAPNDKSRLTKHDKELIHVVPGKVMVVEDDPAMQIHINNVLSPYFDITMCKNGPDAILQLQKKTPPDIIVSDVMMPAMSGFELCEQLKNNPNYAHISIILLTAKADAQSERTGMIHLADDYITKPFSSQSLVMKISNILKTRHAHQARLVDSITENKTVSNDTPQDEFADRVRAEFGKHFADQNYSLNDLASQMNMTERTLARRFQTSFNLTFTSLLRDFRLYQAKLLLMRGMSVSEAAYSCGFSSDSYFGRCYKKKYGLTPTQVKPLKAK